MILLENMLKHTNLELNSKINRFAKIFCSLSKRKLVPKINILIFLFSKDYYNHAIIYLNSGVVFSLQIYSNEFEKIRYFDFIL